MQVGGDGSSSYATVFVVVVVVVVVSPFPLLLFFFSADNDDRNSRIIVAAADGTLSWPGSGGGGGGGRRRRRRARSTLFVLFICAVSTRCVSYDQIKQLYTTKFNHWYSFMIRLRKLAYTLKFKSGRTGTLHARVNARE
jgi:hypothetical protein